ncbi:MAG TPA: hypothetical protein VGD69_25325 [Herpetosiphonaceae bacterium]
MKEIYTYIISDEGINSIVSSIVAAIITYIVIAVFRIRPPRLSNVLFWKKFSKDLIIVVSEVPIEYDPQVRGGSQPQLTPICDAMTLADFLNYFRSECKSNPQIVSINDKNDFDVIKDHNLLIIGGPKYNIAALEFLKEIDTELVYQFKRIRDLSERKTNDSELKSFVSNSPEHQTVYCRADDEIDYGCVVLRNSPYVSGKLVMIVGGLSTLATLAAANWIRTRRFYFWLRSWRASKGFQAIIKCRSIDRVKVSNIEVFFERAFTVLRHQPRRNS